MPKENPDTSKKALTCIHPTYTLATTSEPDNMERVIVNQFLTNLAEVALSVASRKTHEVGEGELGD